MKTILKIAIVFFLSLVPLTVRADNVLLLGDGDADPQVQAALEGAGHTVTYAGRYYEWDGVTPAVTDFDVVVFLDGYYYGYPLQAAAATALQSFVAGGCGLVMTEWTAFDVCEGDKGAIVSSLMPVTMSDCGDYGYSDTWTVDDPSHPLTAGVPASWNDDAGWSTVAPKMGSVVVVSGTGGNPMVVYSNASGGTVVYLNHDMTYSTSTINSNALQLIVNAAEYASCAQVEAGEPIPTVSQWGMVLMSLLLMATAIWSIRRWNASACR